MLPEKIGVDAILAEYMAMSTDDHRTAIFSLKCDLGERLLRMGKAVLAWKKKGFNLDDLGMNGMTYWLLRVGGDEIYAPLLSKTMRDKHLTARLTQLSWTEQKLIGDGGTCELLLLDNKGKADVLKVSPLAINDHEQLTQLLAKDHIRTISEQRAWIEANRAKAAKPIPQTIGHLAPDQERDGCTFLGKRGDFVSADTLLAAYRACRRKSA